MCWCSIWRAWFVAGRVLTSNLCRGTSMLPLRSVCFRVVFPNCSHQVFLLLICNHFGSWLGKSGDEPDLASVRSFGYTRCSAGSGGWSFNAIQRSFSRVHNRRTQDHRVGPWNKEGPQSGSACFSKVQKKLWSWPLYQRSDHEWHIFELNRSPLYHNLCRLPSGGHTTA